MRAQVPILARTTTCHFMCALTVSVAVAVAWRANSSRTMDSAPLAAARWSGVAPAYELPGTRMGRRHEEGVHGGVAWHGQEGMPSLTSTTRPSSRYMGCSSDNSTSRPLARWHKATRWVYPRVLGRSQGCEDGASRFPLTLSFASTSHFCTAACTF